MELCNEIRLLELPRYDTKGSNDNKTSSIERHKSNKKTSKSIRSETMKMVIKVRFQVFKRHFSEHKVLYITHSQMGGNEIVEL